ncbi:MAG TPA: cation:dicarboxylase symporter family transporter, partial [Candidatus Acidoferrales bacterium]|nr:cation:dicarboxylase symporter family transporter [Candidatus Acidoferrales bacterium]
IFLGEITAPLKLVGDGYVQLLQMAVLPYIIIALISGLGKLKYQEAVRLSLRVGSLLLLIWALTLGVAYVLPLSFPKWESASFFSTTLLEQPQDFNFLEFIPGNPFYSMANNIVPAVVLFSIAVGLALMGIERKGPFIAALEILEEALKRVMKFIVRLTPIGIFAIAASTAGTMNVDQLSGLQVYIVSYAIAALLMTFGVLPALIMLLTPFGYREIVRATKDALLMAFATDNLLVVIPMLSDHGKELLRKGVGASAESDSSVDVIVPVSFNFPNVGKLLQLVFILFAAWFTSSAISLAAYFNLTLSGLLSLFGKPVAAMPFLLDLLRLPADMMQLYLASGIFVAQLGTLASAMHLFTLAVLGGFAMAGMLRFQWKRFVPVTALTVGAIAAVVAGTRAYFSFAVENAYDKAKIVALMRPLLPAAPAKVYTSAPPPMPAQSSQPALKRIHTRGTIRVGYIDDNRPFSFFNAQGELVGLDIEMAHILARSLGVGLEFLPVDRSKMFEQLNKGYCDIIMSGIVMTPERAEVARLSTPYQEITVAFVVQDYRRAEFASREALQNLKAPKLAILDVPYFISFVRERLPKAQLVILNSANEFFESKGKTLDAFIYTAEGGSAWSLLYPEYTVVVPPPSVSIPLSYPMAHADQELVDYVNVLIDLKKSDGTLKKLYDYWVLGRFAANRQPRWSVIRNVLHWVS